LPIHLSKRVHSKRIKVVQLVVHPHSALEVISFPSTSSRTLIDGEVRAKVSRIAEQDKLVLGTRENVRHGDLGTSEQDAKALGDYQRATDIVKTEENHAFTVSDLLGRVGVVPGDVVCLA